MSILEKYLGIAFTLILVGLILTNSGKANSIITSLGTVNTNTIAQFQQG